MRRRWVGGRAPFVLEAWEDALAKTQKRKEDSAATLKDLKRRDAAEEDTTHHPRRRTVWLDFGGGDLV